MEYIEAAFSLLIVLAVVGTIILSLYGIISALVWVTRYIWWKR